MIYIAYITIGNATERKAFPTRKQGMDWLAEMIELASTDQLTRMRDLPVSRIGIMSVPDHQFPQGAIWWDVTNDWRTEDVVSETGPADHAGEPHGHGLLVACGG